MPEDNVLGTQGLKAESQLVTFLLKDEEFGFDIMSVQEIIRLPKLAKVPRMATYVDGIANLRGVVLPVIDMRTRFGVEREDETDRTRVLVVDIDGTKTGLRVDRVKQVSRVMRSEIEPPPEAIRGTTSNYVEGVVKLDNGQRIVMALDAGQICEIGVNHKMAAINGGVASAGNGTREGSDQSNADAEVQKVVTFRIAKEEFAFYMEHVREILRVQTPNQVPDVPDYVMGVLTVRGQILPVIDLRRLLQQCSLADEFADSGRPLREEYGRFIEQVGKLFAADSGGKLDASATEHLRTWLIETNSSSQVLMEALAKARGFNERVIKQLQVRAKCEELGDREAARACETEVVSVGREAVAALNLFEQQIAQHIQEDQRIIVVDASGFVLGLVVDHVHEVLNVPKTLVEPPPHITSNGEMKLAGVAKLNDGARLIMLLDVANLMKDQQMREVHSSSQLAVAKKQSAEIQQSEADNQALSEVQLVTFLLGEEEYGVPISQIQEIDRLSKITKVPKAAQFIEGITNLRGEVIPVLDTRKRFELEVKPSDDRTRIMIVDIGGVKTGLVVDSVREVLNLARKDIAPPPEAIGSGTGQQFISGIGKVDAGKRMIVLLDVKRILSTGEMAHLSAVAAKGSASLNS
jgi:chemotaxis signal transduction protein